MSKIDTATTATIEPTDTLAQNTNGTLIIYDASVIAHKLYDLINPIKGTSGNRKRLDAIATAGIDFYNRLSWLPNFDEDCKVVWVSDSKPYWRKEIYSAYKSNRAAEPDKAWFIKRFATECNAIAFDGYEADDIAAAIVQMNAIDPNPRRIVLGTVDSDWLQMVSDRVVWCCLTGYNPQYRDIENGLIWFRNKLSKESQKRQRILREEYGVDGSDLRQIVDWKVVCGDKSDNLPPGCDRCLVDLFAPPEEYRLADRLDIGLVLKSHERDRLVRDKTQSWNFFLNFGGLPTANYCEALRSVRS